MPILPDPQREPQKARRMRWATVILAVLSIGALFCWTQRVSLLRAAGDVNVIESNHMLEGALFVWYAVFIVLVIIYGRLDMRRRKAPETPRGLAIQIGKIVLAFAAALIVCLLFGAALGEMDAYSLLRPTLTFAVAGIFLICREVWEYRRQRR